MLHVSPGRLCAAFPIIVFFPIICLLHSCSGVQPHVYRFTGNGDWKDVNNWKNKQYPGHIIGPADTLVIEDSATCRIPVTLIQINGVMIVKGNLVNQSVLTIAGQMLNRQGSRIINAGTLQNEGMIVCEFGTAITLEKRGKVFNTKGDTIQNNSVMALIHGDFQNEGVFLNQAKGSIAMAGNSYTSGFFQNNGALQIDSALQIKGSFENLGRLWCTNRGVLTIDSGARLHNAYQTGTIRMKDKTQLVIQSTGVLANDDSLWTDNNASIINQGTLTNYTYLYSGGKLTNQGQLVQSSGLRDTGKPATGAAPLASTTMFFGDTILNQGSFDNSGGTMTNTGTGTFISFFQATLKGYNSGIIYAITSQPSNGNCSSPRCQVSFIVGATGNSIGYQWQVSTDKGNTWSNVPSAPPYSGGGSSILEITNPPDTYSGYQYRCVLNGPEEGNQGTSNAATLSLTGRPGAHR